jgi:hypothetical protein
MKTDFQARGGNILQKLHCKITPKALLTESELDTRLDGFEWLVVRSLTPVRQGPPDVPNAQGNPKPFMARIVAKYLNFSTSSRHKCCLKG